MSRLADQGAVHFHGMTLNTACTVIHDEVINLDDAVQIERHLRDGQAVGWKVSDDRGNSRTYLNCDMQTAEKKFRAVFEN